MGGAAAQGDDRVATVFLVHLHAVVNVDVGRVRLGAVEDDGFYAGGFHLLLDLVGNAHSRKTFVGYDEGLGCTQRLNLLAGLLSGTDAHQRNRRNEEAVSLFS